MLKRISNIMFSKKTLVLIIILLIGYLSLLQYKSSVRPISVSKADVENVKVTKSVVASGVVKSLNSVDLAFRNSGVIRNINYSEGDLVTQGSLIATLDVSAFYQEIQATKDSRDIALREKELYIQQYSDNKSRVGGTEEYNINIRRLDEIISRSQATYQASLNALSTYYIYAPVDGTVVDVLFEEGEVVTIGTPVVKLANINDLIFEVSVDQQDFGLLKIDQPVIVTLDSYPDLEFSGMVKSLPSYANDSNGEDFLIEISILNNENVLLGMVGDAEINVVSTESEVTAVIFDIIQTDNSGDFVWINDNGLLKKQYVEIGVEGDLFTEIKTDLTNLQVVQPNEDLEFKEGMKVVFTP